MFPVNLNIRIFTYSSDSVTGMATEGVHGLIDRIEYERRSSSLVTNYISILLLLLGSKYFLLMAKNQLIEKHTWVYPVEPKWL